MSKTTPTEKDLVDLMNEWIGWDQVREQTEDHRTRFPEGESPGWIEGNSEEAEIGKAIVLRRIKARVEPLLDRKPRCKDGFPFTFEFVTVKKYRGNTVGFYLCAVSKSVAPDDEAYASIRFVPTPLDIEDQLTDAAREDWEAEVAKTKAMIAGAESAGEVKA